MEKLKSIPLLSVLLFLLVQLGMAQHQLDGKWSGYIDIRGTQLTIITEFYSTDKKLKGTIDLPQQGAQDIMLQNIKVNAPDSIHFEFMAGMGIAKFKGKFNSNMTISGTFHQSGQQFPFQLTKKQPAEATKSEDETSLPYTQEELVLQNDSISIGGTLTHPKKEKSNQLVIIISGSGAQNRDGKIPVTDFEPYAALAGSLSANGIATFRYDDRGVGESGGNFSQATLERLASDVEAIINHFSKKNPYTFSEIILLGHSQGGVVAGKTAAQNELVDKLILMASTGVSLKKVLRFQAKQAFLKANVDSSLTEAEIMAREQLMKAIANSKNIEQAKENYRNKFKAVQLSFGVDSTQAEEIAKQQVRQLVQAFQSSQMQSLLFYNPSKDLQRLNIPVLVLFGEKDTQVTTEMNKSPIETALDSAGVSYQTKVFENANHLFQKAETGSVQEYATLNNEFTDKFIQTITNWLKNKH